MLGWLKRLFRPDEDKTWVQGQFIFKIEKNKFQAKAANGDLITELPYESESEKSYIHSLLENPEIFECYKNNSL